MAENQRPNPAFEKESVEASLKKNTSRSEDALFTRVMHQHSPPFEMSRQRNYGYPVGRPGKSFRRTRKSKGQGKQNFGCHCEESLQGFIFSTSCHAVFAFLNPFLIGVIQVKFQGTSQSAFQTRLPSMWAFLLATFLYCFAFAANMKFKYTTYFRFSGHVAFLAGSFSSISLVSFLLPARLGPLVFVAWAILPIMVARSTVQFICLWIYERIMTFSSISLDGMSIEEQPQDPVEIV
ncbi:PROTEIN putative-RELATED [Salix viminalis]|uniref:PROTEIN putative-RELATED n=1 Tax=Salix viminalis TaxID=40686 RepID=A0A9Q0NTE6_SALVM|nr:PROTEIN putative-RELATED [Salix viminalis]